MDLGPGQAVDVRVRYPHMLEEDAKVWREYLERGLSRFNEVWYDVHVGVAMAVPPDAPGYMKAVVDGVSRKRIDVVGLVGLEWVVVELKGHGNMQSIGQVVTYRDLFKKEFGLTGGVRAMIICGSADRDILQTAERMGVEIIALHGVLL